MEKACTHILISNESVTLGQIRKSLISHKKYITFFRRLFKQICFRQLKFLVQTFTFYIQQHANDSLDFV